jgi:hypothetical protein
MCGQHSGRPEELGCLARSLLALERTGKARQMSKVRDLAARLRAAYAVKCGETFAQQITVVGFWPIVLVRVPTYEAELFWFAEFKRRVEEWEALAAESGSSLGA